MAGFFPSSIRGFTTPIVALLILCAPCFLGPLYCLIIWIQTRLNPDCAPAYESPPVRLGRKLYLIAVNILPLGLVIFSVVGFILLGIATPVT